MKFYNSTVSLYIKAFKFIKKCRKKIWLLINIKKFFKRRLGLKSNAYKLLISNCLWLSINIIIYYYFCFTPYILGLLLKC
jgi:hypothetical protein